MLAQCTVARTLSLFALDATAYSWLTLHLPLSAFGTWYSQPLPWLVGFGQSPSRIHILAIDMCRYAISTFVDMVGTLTLAIVHPKVPS